jgi:hypothetical protein
MTAAPEGGAAAACCAEMPEASGGGATTEVASPPPGRVPPWPTLGGGATTEFTPPARGDRVRSVADSGTDGAAGEVEARLGLGAVAAFRSGGTTRLGARFVSCATSNGFGWAGVGCGRVRTRVFGRLLFCAEYVWDGG